MAEVKWIKITTDMFDDDKIDFICSLPEADAIVHIWVRLLTMAGKCNAGGYIFLTENIPYTEEMLAHKFKKPISIIRLAIETFKRLDMLEADSKGFYLPNFEKHQNIEGLEKIKEQTRLRVANHRAKQKLLVGNVTSNATVTESNATDIERDIDKEIDKIKIMTAEEEAIITVLKSIPNYPLSLEKDLLMINNLKERYPQLNLLESIKDYAILKVDRPLKPKENPRSQINTSCKKHVEWKRNLISQKPIIQSNTTTDLNSLYYNQPETELSEEENPFKKAIGGD